MLTDLDVNAWLELLLDKLQNTWGDRLLFAGHTGSWVRGEAGPESDIDVNVVLDRVGTDDLRAYRRIVGEMPHSEKACGFICSLDEIRAWPRHELFHFVYGCRVLHGRMEDVAEIPSASDLRDFVRVSASGILHGARHQMIYSPDLGAAVHELKPFWKGAFFILQTWVFLTTGEFVPNRREMSRALTDPGDRDILRVLADWESLAEDRAERPEQYFGMLADWSAGMLLRADAFTAA